MQYLISIASNARLYISMLKITQLVSAWVPLCSTILQEIRQYSQDNPVQRLLHEQMYHKSDCTAAFVDTNVQRYITRYFFSSSLSLQCILKAFSSS